MKLNKTLPALALLALASAFTLHSPEATANTDQGEKLVLHMTGYAFGELRSVALPTETIDANCFAANVYDISTGELLGVGIDCLTNVQPDGDGLTLTDYTIFKLADGTLITKSEVGLQTSSAPWDQKTHMTGSFPAPDENSIVGGTGRYAGATGTVRLSGGVDMSNAEQNQVGFDCIFVIEFD